ncbi:hypothetical protein Leryth_009449 [Lithospermum erythrorhizon]|nr:hypothetical protein Leryth_009449 [Lithospermum erythrorhizon]
MEDWWYGRENYRERLRSRWRSPMRKLGLRDRDYSPRRMYEIEARCGGHEVRDKYRCGKQCESEIDMARIRGREYRPRDCGGGGDDGREYDRMRVVDWRRSPRGTNVEGLREREYCGRGGGDYDWMGFGDRSRSPKRREVEVLIEREYRGCGGGGEYDRMSFCERRHSPKGREVEVSREREYRGGGGGDYDRTRVGDRMHSPRGREVEVLREREYSGRGGDYDRTRVGDRMHSPRGREVEVLTEREYSGRGGDGEYDRMRLGGQNYSPMGREVEVVRDGREYEKARFADGECSLGKRNMSATWSVAEHEMKIIDQNCSPNQQEMKEACTAEEYEDRIAERRYSLMLREIDGIQSGKEYEGSRMLDQESAMVPMMEKRLMDEHMPEQVWLRRDYDRAPPDVVNKGGDHDGGFPWSMRLSCDDDRSLKRDNGNTDGLLQKRYYQFDDTLSSMGSTPLKFQRNILEEHRKADTFRSNRELGVCDARLYSERDNSSKQFMDVGISERLLGNNGMLVKSDSGRGFSYSCPSDTIASKHCGVGSCGHLLTPHPENSYHKHVDLHGDCYLDKLTGDRPFMGDEITLKLSKGEYDFIPSSSLSNVFSTMPSDGYVEEISPLVKEADNRGSGGVVLSCGISGKPLLYDRHGQNPVSGSPIINARQSNDNRYSSRSYLSLPEEHKYSAYQKMDRREDDHIGAGSCDIYGNSCDFVETDGYQDMLRGQNQELDLDREKCEFSKQDHSSDGSHQWNLDPYLIRRSMPDYANAVESSHLKKQDMDILDYRDPHLLYDTRIHDDSVRNQHLEYHDHRKGHGCHCHHDRSEIMRSGKYHPNLDGLDSSKTQKLFPHNMNLCEPPETLLRHRHLTGSVSFLSSDALQLSSSLRIAHQTKDEKYIKNPCGSDELDFLAVSKKSRYSSSRFEETANGCMDLSSRLTNRKLSQPLENFFLSKDTKSSGRDIKSRLGPSPQDAHASHSAAKKHKFSVKKRLGHPPNKNQVTLPWIKNLTSPKLSLIQKDSGRNHDQEEDILEGNGCCRRVDSNRNAPKLSNIQQGSERRLDQGGDYLEANETFRKAEPAENSEEFKQLVHSNFFKFVKQLNETLARRRKFMDHGKYGPLKCLVCGSDSLEFPDTESLVMHALSCNKVGSKCEHLGFHKALCVLMGWRSAEVPNDSWVCEMLTDVETSALKDDLIIWPPVVVVHNSTIADVLDKQITLSVEEFEAKLRGKVDAQLKSLIFHWYLFLFFFIVFYVKCCISNQI